MHIILAVKSFLCVGVFSFSPKMTFSIKKAYRLNFQKFFAQRNGWHFDCHIEKLDIGKNDFGLNLKN